MEVLTPRTLPEALELRASASRPLPLQGGTDLMVGVNFGRQVPETVLNLSEVSELRGWSRENGTVRLGAALTYTEAMDSSLAELLPALSEAARSVGSPQIRNRGTIGGNLGTASPAGDALPPLMLEDARVELASVRGSRRLPLGDFIRGPKRNALEPGELITALHVKPSCARQTFMKIGPRNAMVISIASLALAADRERGELRAVCGSSGPVPFAVVAPFDERPSFAEQVVAASAPIDDVRGSAAYRRHALHVLTERALERCLG